MSNPVRLIALIPAAGSGSRMGLAAPKALLQIGGVPLIRRTVERLKEAADFLKFVIVHAPGKEEEFKQALSGLSDLAFCPGGDTRQQSVARGLDWIEKSASPAEDLYILVHDAARCMVTPDLVARTISEVQIKGAVTAAVRLVDSIAAADEQNALQRSLPRENVWQIQTPQVFEYALLKEAHGRAAALSKFNYGDESSIVRELHEVFVVDGERTNIKVTTQEDLRLAEVFCRFLAQPVQNIRQ